MTDLRTLTDAFAELERRADAASNVVPAGRLLELRRRRGASASRLLAVAATAAMVVGLAAGSALLASVGSGSGVDAPAAGSSTAPPPSTAAPPSSTEPPPPSAEAPPSLVPNNSIPGDGADLAARFTAVLGGSATFTRIESGPVARPPEPGATTARGIGIGGELTASGVSGTFDLAIYTTSPVDLLMCNDPTSCINRTLDDGSTLWAEQAPTKGVPGGITNWACLVTADGRTINLHVFNTRSKDGGSLEVLAPQPPLSVDQMIPIVTSDRW